MIKILITDQVDNYRPGDTPEVTTTYGEALVKLGVAEHHDKAARASDHKAAPAPKNKMAPSPQNKGQGASGAVSTKG